MLAIQEPSFETYCSRHYSQPIIILEAAEQADSRVLRLPAQKRDANISLHNMLTLNLQINVLGSEATRRWRLLRRAGSPA